MIEIFEAGNVDDATESALFTTKEQARLCCQLEYENIEMIDSANFAITFQRPTEERMKQSFSGRKDLDMHEFLVLSTGDKTEDGSWYWFVRTVEVYETADELYRATGS